MKAARMSENCLVSEREKFRLTFYKVIEMIKNCLITDHLGIIFMLQSIVLSSLNCSFLGMMNENRMISWEEAEQIMGGSANEPIKSSLPQQTRPTEPDNDTDVDRCIQRYQSEFIRQQRARILIL